MILLKTYGALDVVYMKLLALLKIYKVNLRKMQKEKRLFTNLKFCSKEIHVSQSHLVKDKKKTKKANLIIYRSAIKTNLE